MQIYRVRKRFDDIKGQKGACYILQNAINIAKKTKCNVYDGSKRCVWDYSIYLKERRERNAKPL